MISSLVQQKVKDFAVWKKAFDSIAGARASYGQLSEKVFQDASDPNLVTILIKWESLEKGQKWFQSPELKAAQAKAGLDGPIAVSLLKEV